MIVPTHKFDQAMNVLRAIRRHLRLANVRLRTIIDKPADLEGRILKQVDSALAALSPDDALRFLFRLDAELYERQGQKSVEYGKGVHTKHRHTRYHDFFIERIKPCDKVLDVGCGIGSLAHDIAVRSGATVVGIDLNERNIATARERFAHPSVRYTAGDVLSTPIDSHFDVVVLSNVLEHMLGRPELLRRLQGSTDASRFLIRVPLFERDWRVPLKQELGVEWRLDVTHETEYSMNSFRAEISEARLVISDLEVCWGEIWAETRPENA